MLTQDIEVIPGQIPWITGWGALDDSMCPGGWEQALAESDSFGWRLSLYTKDVFEERVKTDFEMIEKIL